MRKFSECFHFVANENFVKVTAHFSELWLFFRLQRRCVDMKGEMGWLAHNFTASGFYRGSTQTRSRVLCGQ